MHDVTLLVDIALALAYALIGGLVARRLRLPPDLAHAMGGLEIGSFAIGDASPLAGDRVAVIGSPAEVADAGRLLGGPEEVTESVES